MPIEFTGADVRDAYDSSGVTGDSLGSHTGNIQHGYSYVAPYLTDGLAGWWPLYEDSGDALDFSGNGNNGTVNGATQGVAGIRGAKCYDFDGVDDYIDTGYNESVGINDSRTYSIWFKSTDSTTEVVPIGTDGTAAIIELYWNGSNNTEFFIRDDGNNIVTASLNTDYRDGEWHLFTGILDRDTDTITVNIDGGEDVATEDASSLGTLTENTPLYIGAKYNGGSADNYYTGQIQDARIYDRALTPVEVQELYKQGSPYTPRLEKGNVDVTSGLVSRYTMDDTEVSGSTLTDVAGSNDGTINGATTGIKGVDGGEAFDFDGVDDNITTTTNLSEIGTGPFTISFWVNISNLDPSQYPTFLSTWNSGNGFIFGMDDGVDNYQLRFRLGSQTHKHTRPNTGQWYHIVGLRKSNGDTQFIVDASIVATGSVTQDITDDNLTIGRRPDTTNPSEGIIDEVRIYDRALSQSEVNTLYQNFDPYSKSRAPTNPNTVSSGGVARYSMDNVDVSGSTLTDTFGTNDGTINGATTGVAGVGGGEAFDFDGVDDNINVSGLLSNVTSEITISTWAKVDSGSTDVETRAFGLNNSGKFLSIHINDGGVSGDVTFFSHDSSGDVSITTTSVNTDKWNHYLGTVKENDLVEFYINGIKVGESSIGTLESTSDLGEYIGTSRSNSSGFFDGQIDEVRIYDRALNATEVWTLYQQGKRLIPELVEAR